MSMAPGRSVDRVTEAKRESSTAAVLQEKAGDAAGDRIWFT